jgi:hypothetical protein
MSNKIQVYQAEKDAGLEEIIVANASIAYESPALSNSQLLVNKSKDIRDAILPEPFTKAAQDDPDIHHVYSILVSTTWNKNDDVFDKAEVWSAKNTPKFKPTNLEHDEKQIVGGIIDNWVVNDSFELIAENSEPNDLPDHYHILVASVIYKQWQDPAYRQRALDLIEEIEANQKYVSMECVFNGFDYAVIGPDNKHHVIARNNETAFLTQHLRSYGGTGSYQEHQVGRLLRNITFSGKGFVDRPANPESVIFDKNKVFEFNNASISSKNTLFNDNGVLTKVDNYNHSDLQESNNMSNEILSDQITDLKTALDSAQAENKELADKLAEANVEKYEQSIKEQAEQLAVKAEQIETLTTDLETAQNSVSDLTGSIEESKEACAKFESQISEMQAIEKARSRKAMLVEAGLTNEEAEAKMETFSELSDEQFTALSDTLAAYTSKKKKEDEEDEDTEASVEVEETQETEASQEVEETEAKVDEEVLETVQAEESTPLSVESDAAIASDEGLEVVRAGLKDWVQTVILDNNN